MKYELPPKRIAQARKAKRLGQFDLALGRGDQGVIIGDPRNRQVPSEPLIVLGSRLGSWFLCEGCCHPGIVAGLTQRPSVAYPQARTIHKQGRHPVLDPLFELAGSDLMRNRKRALELLETVKLRDRRR